MNNCERCGQPRKVNAFGLCDDCQIELAGEPNPVDPGELKRFRAALSAPEPTVDALVAEIMADAKAKGWPGTDRPLVVEVGGAPEPPACPNCDAGRVMRLDDGNLYCPFCGWQTLSAVTKPPSSALVNDGGPEYPAAEAWHGYAEAAEERAVAAERKLARYEALVKAAEELTRAALAVHDNVWQPRDSDWLRVDDDSVVDMARAAEDCRDALAALEENNRE